MICELDCANCYPKKYCSWRDFSAFNNLGKAEAINIGRPKMPGHVAHILADSRKPLHTTNAPANIGGGIAPAIVHEHEALKEFVTDELNRPSDESRVKEEIKKLT